MRLTTIICLIGFCLIQALKLNAQNDSTFSRQELLSFPLKSFADNSLQFKDPYTAFIFLSPECPLCQNLMPTLNELNEKFNGPVRFIGIVPGNAYPLEMISRFINEYKIPFPVYIDSSMRLSNYLQAAVTPQVILLNNEAQLVYKGAVDNVMMELGKKRLNVTQRYFKDALEAITSNRVVVKKRTKAIGCLINDY